MFLDCNDFMNLLFEFHRLAYSKMSLIYLNENNANE